MGRRVVALLAGEVASGKTTVCQKVAEAARRRGLRVGGILTQPLYDALGRRVGLRAVDLWRRESRLLASVHRPLSDLRQGRYCFDPAAFAWAEQAVLASLEGDPGLVILDEVGPLELEAGAGFAPLLGPVLAAGCPVLLVVRRGCCAALAARLPAAPVVFDVCLATRDALPAKIVAALCNPRVAARGSLRKKRCP
jgi:nucleoside-triphosphatase THEP1